ncbi:hypothetical protein [Vibrio owensii]|uniref:hypothetical protein n=1 Tax=Vibrio owensii TaxID=696485 RepID=UPI004068FBD1
MKIPISDLDLPQYKKLRANLRVIYGTKPTRVGRFLCIVAGFGEVVFVVGIILTLFADTTITTSHMFIGLALSWVMGILANLYDKRFGKLALPKEVSDLRTQNIKRDLQCAAVRRRTEQKL